jgi:hypothetical protein
MLVRRARSDPISVLNSAFQKALAESWCISSQALIDTLSTLNCGPPLSLVELVLIRSSNDFPVCTVCPALPRREACGGVRISHPDVESPLTSLGSIKLHFFLIHPPDQENRCSIYRMRPRIREIDDTPAISPDISNAEIESRKFSYCICVSDCQPQGDRVTESRWGILSLSSLVASP